MERVVKEEIGLGDGDPEPGLTRYDEMMRQKQLLSLLARDAFKITPGTKFAVTLPCEVAHPGLCAEVDAGCLPQAKATAKAAWSYFADRPCGAL